MLQSERKSRKEDEKRKTFRRSTINNSQKEKRCKQLNNEIEKKRKKCKKQYGHAI